MRDVDRLIVGGGIAGLATKLIRIRLKIFEAVVAPKPMGVGINIQPNAVRELFAIISAALLDTIGIEAKEWALVGLSGRDIYAEPRGRSAGYRWPQYCDPSRSLANAAAKEGDGTARSGRGLPRP